MLNLVCYYLMFFSFIILRKLGSPLFSFTSWGYQHPPTPPIVKRPYLFRPDHRPAGASGYKRNFDFNHSIENSLNDFL
jgi:hypothetical protein